MDRLITDVSVDDYDALLLPGGTVNPDQLRINSDAVSFVRDFFGTGKPIGTICHGPWTLLEAGVVEGRRMTSWPSVRTDLRNAGAEVLDQEVVTDQGSSPAVAPTICRLSAPRSWRSSPRGRITRDEGPRLRAVRAARGGPVERVPDGDLVAPGQAVTRSQAPRPCLRGDGARAGEGDAAHGSRDSKPEPSAPIEVAKPASPT